MSIGEKDLLLAPEKEKPFRKSDDERPARDRKRRDRIDLGPDADKQRYWIDVGHEHGVKPGNIVGAIANEAGLAGDHIGSISIEKTYSLVDLPAGMPKDVFMDLKKVRVCGRPMNIRLDEKREKVGRAKTEKHYSGKPKSGKPRAEKAKPGKAKPARKTLGIAKPGKPKSARPASGKPKPHRGKKK